jgi:hypothetical protein
MWLARLALRVLNAIGLCWVRLVLILWAVVLAAWFLIC